MKVLLDENVSGGLARSLRKLGFSVLQVGADLPAGSTDEAVFRFILKERSILVTRDHHFTNPVRFDERKTQGIIYIHHGNLTSDQEIAMVAGFLRDHPQGGFEGKLVTLYPTSARIR